jgi:hypothetical protein
MVDNLTSAATSRLGRRTEHLYDENAIGQNRAMMVFLGFAATGLQD